MPFEMHIVRHALHTIEIYKIGLRPVRRLGWLPVAQVTSRDSTPTIPDRFEVARSPECPLLTVKVIYYADESFVGVWLRFVELYDEIASGHVYKK